MPPSLGRRRGSSSDQLKCGAHIDPSLQAARDGTEPSMEIMHALRLLTPIRGHRKAVVDRDALDHEHLVLGLYLADSLHFEPFRLDLDLTRLQRAGESARQSAAGGGNDIVECRRMRRELARRNPVVLSDLGMHPEHHWILLSGKVCQALRTAKPLDTHAGDVADLTHWTDATPSFTARRSIGTPCSR